MGPNEPRKTGEGGIFLEREKRWRERGAVQRQHFPAK